MSAHELHLLSHAKMFNGHQEQYRCFSETCQTDMTFGIYLPPQVLKGYPAPVLYFLSGLHGDGSELIRQTGIQRFAAQWNIIVVFPDTSPRGSHISDSANEFIGQGAGFYLDATERPWAAHYQMYNHISRELPDWVERHFPATQERSIAGFSMGGHGALSIALKIPTAMPPFPRSPFVPPDRQPRRKAGVCRLSGRGIGGLAGLRQHIARSDDLTQAADIHRPRRYRSAVPRRTATRSLRQCRPRQRLQRAIQSPPRLRTRLFLHRQLYRLAYRVSRRRIGFVNPLSIKKGRLKSFQTTFLIFHT